MFELGIADVVASANYVGDLIGVKGSRSFRCLRGGSKISCMTAPVCFYKPRVGDLLDKNNWFFMTVLY
jgi:hypothetical protein